MPSKPTQTPGRSSYVANWLWQTIFLLVFYCLANEGVAQRPGYTISVRLDTAKHMLHGHIEIKYTNRTSGPMDKLGVHLYPNAYSNHHTAFARQRILQGDVEFAHATAAEMGYIRDLKFASNDVDQLLELDALNPDIGWIQLTTPLPPGQSITLTSPFTVKIPKSFSRIGHTGDSYQLTQWYPHIAVADEQGWHTMPYLDYGEYFNDFADYKVEISLPLGYTVASTGSINKSGFSDGVYEAWSATAENVIDFAWFASPHFSVETKQISSRDKNIDVKIYTDTTVSRHWNHAMEYAQRAVEHYTAWLGAYPYDQVSVVSTPRSAAGFMEYPMVAQISYAPGPSLLETVIAHEIGHTWLYGALANNERLHPWMDEGLNTFVERRYTERYLPEFEEIALSPELSGRQAMSQDEAWQHFIRYSNKTQPPNADPQWQSINQYVLSAYTLPAQGFELLMAQVGEAMMRDMINMYFEDHKYQHVTPADMRSSFESICDCDLGWFFSDWMQHAHEIDYRMTAWRADQREITIENHGPAGIPLQLTTYKDEKPVETFWINGFAGEKQIAYNLDADEIKVFDAAPAVNKVWWNRVRPRPVIPYFTLFPKIASYEKASVNITPFAATNVSDGAMPGLVFTSGMLPTHKFRWILAPFYGLESKSIRGYGAARYAADIRNGAFDKFLLSFSADYFGYEVDTHYHYRSQYLRLSPELGIRIEPKDEEPLVTRWLKYRYVDLQQFYGKGINYEEGTFTREKRSYGIHEIAYEMHYDHGLHPLFFAANAQTGKGFLRFNLNYKQHFRGRDKQRGLWVYGYTGFMPVYDNPDASVHFDIHGYASNGVFANDFMFDHWLGGRNENSGIYAHQVYPRDANLKTLATHGIGNDWMIGGGLSLAMPFKWIHAYMDAAYYPNAVEQEVILSYSGGAALVLVKDVFEIYLPLVESRDIRESLSYVVRDQWFERVSFQFNFKFSNPLDLADRWTLRY